MNGIEHGFVHQERNTNIIKLAPSILFADFANLEREILCVQNAGAHYLHIDVMDGLFVPNITIGAQVVKALTENGVIAIIFFEVL